MEPVTATQVRAWSQVRFERFGLVEDTDLQEFVNRATGYVFIVTGQTYESMTDDVFGMLVQSQLRQAIQMRTEQVVLQGKRGYVGSAAEKDVIQSFSAGGYSETRTTGGFSRAGAAEKSINSWPALSELLWLLMTDERFAWWVAFTSGQSAPDFTIEEYDWRGLSTVLAFFEPWDGISPNLVGY
jgi:hypothetical protein